MNVDACPGAGCGTASAFAGREPYKRHVRNRYIVWLEMRQSSLLFRHRKRRQTLQKPILQAIDSSKLLLAQTEVRATSKGLVSGPGDGPQGRLCESPPHLGVSAKCRTPVMNVDVHATHLSKAYF